MTDATISTMVIIARTANLTTWKNTITFVNIVSHGFAKIAVRKCANYAAKLFAFFVVAIAKDGMTMTVAEDQMTMTSEGS